MAFKMKGFSGFTNSSPMKCWTKAGYVRKPGTKAGTKGSCYKPSSPLNKQQGGGTTKTCLPADKIRVMSKEHKDKLIRAKRKSGKRGDYKRDSKTNVKGVRAAGATLKDWFEKEDWRQVNNPSKKCGEK